MNEESVFPSDFVRRLHQLVPDVLFPSVMEGLTNERVTTARVNTLAATMDQLKAEFSAHGISIEQAPGFPLACIIHAPLRTVTELPFYTSGKMYVQSLSSMVPPVVLAPVAGERVLDLAAAPGSKTTQLAAIMENGGEIIANDTSPTRSYRLAANCQMQHVTNVKTIRMDGRQVWTKYPEHFDRVLVDVPCSMEGRFLTSDPDTYRDWSLKKVRDLSLLQRWLLRSAISATKPGGIIVYSTCTLSPEENEQVIDWVLSKDKGVVSVEPIELDPAIPIVHGLTSFGDKHYHQSLSQSIRIYPSRTMEGFFVAKLKKLKSSIPRVLQ